MRKGIYTYYKERLVEIGGNSKCLYLKNVVRRGAYDIGRIFEGRENKVSELVNFLWQTDKEPLTLISEREGADITKNLEIHNKKIGFNDGYADESDGLIEDEEKNKKKRASVKKTIEGELAKIRELKREVEEIERETGRSELYVGYPFVFGSLTRGGNKNPIKAPLLLFPVRIEIIDECTAELRINEAESVRINPALIYAYAQAKRLNIDKLELEFDGPAPFKSVKEIIEYLKRGGVKIECTLSRNVHGFTRFKEPDGKNQGLAVRYAAVLARFSLSNSIYNDYTALEKKSLTNDAIDELLRTKKRGAKETHAKKVRPNDRNSYAVKMLDFAQAEVVKKVDKNGNMVIYGPPGTGKSQTIVNIITDAICKNKRVLVVSQKRAALDVVYSRLGMLNQKAMYLTDEGKQKQLFYDRCLEAHQRDMLESLEDVEGLQREYNELERKIDAEVHSLEVIFDTMNKKRKFGLSLTEMYSSSFSLSKSSSEYATYIKMLESKDIMALDYKAITDALFGIRSMNLERTYYKFIEDKEKNPLIDCMRPDIDIRTLSEVKGALEEIQKSRKGLFNIAKHPYYRQVLAYYPLFQTKRGIGSVVNMEYKLRRSSSRTRKTKDEITEELYNTYEAIKAYAEEYDCLHRVLTDDGYLAVIDNILRGNTSYIKLVYDALDTYIDKRDISNLLLSLDKNKLTILNFAYTASKSYQNYVSIIDKLLEIRIYHEIIGYEELCKDELALIVDYPNITSKIYKLKEAQLEVAYRLCSGKNSREYDNLYARAKNNKDYLYQISKKQKYWPIRKTMDVYGDFILALFPCWLLSPENVSSFLPLNKNMFDIVIFDEASQVFIESTIPTIYRGKNIVVAGDSKQLRPSATFMKRYLGADPELQDDYSMQAALEVESLLDLAVSRYESANLTYHYRSRHQELIDFSNSAFYSSGLQIVPNLSKNRKSQPIERHLVSGRWVDRKNTEEAKKVVELLESIFKTRKNNESIGIITFNSDQQTCIADAIDKRALADDEFRAFITAENHRTDNGEDTSLFIKNLENVQGEERDIIIFSIGYAKNEQGKVYTNFGSLSMEGGENRLNVAITRAKTKIYVVTSIEPEELKVDDSKNLGPKLLRSYLMYVRAVSSSNKDEAKTILADLDSSEAKQDRMFTKVADIEDQIQARLEKLGYHVDKCIGNRKNRISLAIYDSVTDKYLVGIVLDKDAYLSSDSSVERDVYMPRFLMAQGWNILRVWCRDWWLYPNKVIKTIVNIAESEKLQKTK